MGIVTVDYVKTFFGISDAAEDARLEQLVSQASALFASSVGYDIEEVTRTEYHSGTGDPLLFLNSRRVTEITSIHYDSSGWFGQAGGAFAAATLLTEGVDYALICDDQDVSWGGMIRRINGVWPTPVTKPIDGLNYEREGYRGNLKVVFKCGWAAGDMPEDLKYAACLTIGVMRRKAKAGGPTSGYSFEGFSRQFGAEAPDDVTSIESTLSSYRKWICNR